MNAYRYEAFIEEFLFLKGIFKKEKRASHVLVDQMTVQMVDENFLNRVLVRCGHGLVQYRETLWAVMPDGSFLQVPVQVTINGNEGQPVIEALIGLEEATHFVLTRRDFHFGEGYSHQFSVIVYKASRKTSLAKEIEKARRIALVQVQQEADF